MNLMVLFLEIPALTRPAAVKRIVAQESSVSS
jgi:hypothetical protein